MSAVLSAAGSLAKGLATLERLLDSEDEKVALKAAELLLRLHPDVPKRKAAAENVREDEPRSSLGSGLQPVFPNDQKRPEARTPTKPVSPANSAAKKLLLAAFNTPPSAPRSDPLPAPFPDGSRPLTSFLGSPKSAPAPSG